jgi:taurine dioxygenase/pentalenolactone F synthase
MDLNVTPFADQPFGAEVRGFEPDEEPTPELVERISRALADHVILLFRGHQRPRDEELIRFASAFGVLFDGGEIFGMSSPSREILQLTSQLDAGGVETGPSAVTPLPWHTDYSYLRYAAKMSLLEALELPPDGGAETWFCDLYAAYEALDPAVANRIGDLVGVHELGASGRHLTREEKDFIRSTRGARSPEFNYPGFRIPALHPLVERHPDTGRPALYVNSLVGGIDGMDPDEGRALVDELFEHAAADERIYRHAWEPGDLILFDTVGTMHRRGITDGGGHRVMRQMSVMLTGDDEPTAAVESIRSVASLADG